jgi:hypothetical protein
MLDMSICQNEEWECLNQKSKAWFEFTQITTSIAISDRKADVLYSHSNGSLLTISRVSKAAPRLVQPDDIFKVFEKFFTVPTNGSLITAEDLVSWTWMNVNGYLTESDLDGAQTFLRALLTFPHIWFQGNGNPNTTVTNTPRNTTDSKSNLNVSVRFVQAQNLVIVATWTAVFFVLVGSSIYIWCFAWLCWGLSLVGPETDSFPLVAFGSKLSAGRTQDMSLAKDLAPLAGTADVRTINGKRIYLRVIVESDLEEDRENETSVIRFWLESKDMNG